MLVAFGENTKIRARLPIDAKNRRLHIGPSEVMLSVQIDKPSLNIDFSTNNATLGLDVLHRENTDVRLVFSPASILPKIESVWKIPKMPHMDSAVVMDPPSYVYTIISFFLRKIKNDGDDMEAGKGRTCCSPNERRR